MTVREAVICEPVRTPIGRYGGMFASQSAVDLGVAALTGLLERTGVPPDAVQDVILGHCYPNSEAPAIGRVVGLDSGLPVTVPGMQVDRRCGSGLQAVIQACLQIQSGDNDLVVAGGAESMSNVAFYSTDMRWGGARGVQVHDGLARGRTTAGGRHYPVPGGMLETAENLRRQYGISRQEQDELAVQVAPTRGGGAEGRRTGRGDRPGHRAKPSWRGMIDTDEHPRADTTVESLSKLKPVLLKDDPEATVTAGNASGQNDAASMCLVTTPERAAELGLTPLVRLVSWASAGVAPNVMGIGPVPATQSALAKAGLQLSDIDLIELNEAFAAQALAVMREWGFGAADHERTNVHGSGISLGHPVGATGGRMLATLSRELHRRDARYGLETMCIGGGQGLAAIFERVSAAMTAPLADLTVVEVSSFVAAPLCGMTLSQLGAKVIRVDPIGGASDTHRWPVSADGTSIYWTGLNKGKRSATIDLRSADGQELVQRLIIEGGGIVVTNAASLSWLSYDDARRQASRPDPSSSPGPSRRLHRSRLHGQRGNRISVGHRPGGSCRTDQSRATGLGCRCGLYAALAIVAAVRRRDQSGIGAQISLPLEDVALATAGNLGLLTEPQINGTQRERLGNAIYGQYGQDFTSCDGVAFMVVTLTKRHFQDLVDVTGCSAAISALSDSLGADFGDEGVRYRYRGVLSGLFATWFADHPADEITRRSVGDQCAVRALPELRRNRRRRPSYRQSVVLPAAPGRTGRVPGARTARRVRRHPFRRCARAPPRR